VVLVASDFSEGGNGAVAQGASIVVESGTIHLAHVAPGCVARGSPVGPRTGVVLPFQARQRGG
jgi:hypothetical protein